MGSKATHHDFLAAANTPALDPSSSRAQAATPATGAARRILRKALPSLAIAGGLGVLELARSRFQRSHMFLPSRYPDGVWDPSAYGLPYADAWFESSDGIALHGWWIEHPKAHGTVLYCHGNAGNISDRLAVYRHLRRLRLNIFAFDYRGYGRSAGEPSEQGLCRDARAAYDHLVGELGRDPGEVLLFGHSLGGAVAVDAALHRPAAGLVVQSSFTDLRSMARHFYTSWPIYLLARNGFRSIEKVSRLELPKLFIHGTEDGTVPFHMGEALFAAAAEPKHWMAVPNAGHNDVHRYRPLRYFRALSRFRKRCLKPS